MTFSNRLNTCTALFCSMLLSSSALFAQDANKPTITNIPGCLFVEWIVPIDVAAVQLGKGLTGQYEIMLNLPSASVFADLVGKRPGPVTDPKTITVLADYWIVRGKPEKAIPLYENSLRQGGLEEAYAQIFQNNLAMLYSQTMGQHDKALELVNLALETKADNVTLLDTKGLILINNNAPAEAVPPLQRAVELSCQYPSYCLHLAYALHQDGRDSQSRRYLDPVRDQLIPTVPNMSKEDKEMFDKLQLALPPVVAQ